MTNRMGGNLSLFLAGALLGTAAVTLTAPYSGKRIRRLARRKIEGGAGRLSEVAKGLSQRRGDLLSRGEKIVRGAQKLLA
jgi:gas vesicle protein